MKWKQADWDRGRGRIPVEASVGVGDDVSEGDHDCDEWTVVLVARLVLCVIALLMNAASAWRCVCVCLCVLLLLLLVLAATDTTAALPRYKRTTNESVFMAVMFMLMFMLQAGALALRLLVVV
jgi:hypothetical protein